jgi:restriction system protein
MAVPDYQTFMLPVLRYAGANTKRSIPKAELIEAMAREFRLSDEEQREMLPSGASTTFGSRVSWACTYMKKAGLIEAPQRAHIRISPQGVKALAANPTAINVAFLKQYPAFQAFHTQNKKAVKDAPIDLPSDKTPQESIEVGYQSLRVELAADLLQQISTCSPTFFERLVIELLVKMGYGGSLRDAAQVVGKSGDGGIDGIIKEDKLGLDAIYVQAKRWNDKPVGRPDVQQFAGALAGNKATKGIFITTSTFTKDAVEFAKNVNNSKIVLIDGDELAELMIDHNVGVSVAQVYEVKRIDSDYFAEGE